MKERWAIFKQFYRRGFGLLSSLRRAGLLP
jgi:hypothetical protein